MKNKTTNSISLVCNAAVLILVAYSIVCFFIRVGEGNMQVIGTECFKFFTIDSNVLCALCSALVIPYNIMILCGKANSIPKWVNMCKLVGTTAVMVTLLTVVFFLGPVQGSYKGLFAGSSLYLHLICPILAIISYGLFEKQDIKNNWMTSFLGVLPTLIYGIIYLIMVIIIGENNGGWKDFYGFNIGGMWYVSVVAMLAATFGISVTLLKLNNKVPSMINKD